MKPTDTQSLYWTSEVEVRIFHRLFSLAAAPLPGAPKPGGRARSWLWSGATRFLAMFSSLNLRDHRKLCVIDEKIAWVGSLNICRSHVSLHPQWRDYAARVTGGSVDLLR